MSYRIRPMPRAEADIERLYASILERRDAEAARDWYESCCIAAERLLTMPLSCGLAYENPHFDEEIRHLVFGHRKRKHRALFTVRGEVVVILAVRAPGESPLSPDEFMG